LSQEFRAGSLLAGYRLEVRLGAGGMAVVFRARDERLGRLVALKILAPEIAEDREFRRRFIAESRAAAKVEDPHIIPVHEAGEADGVLFIAMRFVAGGDLRRVLEREGALAPGRAVEFISPVASALDAAHRTGLVHRDVKPANILVDASPDRPDHVYLSDFGVSKGAVSSASRTGHFLGTPNYSAPEQIQGLAVDGRADQYALACVAYQLLTGEVPFERDQDMAVLYAHVSEPPPSLGARRPDLPSAADRVLARAMAKAPENRYGCCREFADALREALGLSPYHSPNPASALGYSPTQPVSPPPRSLGSAPAGSRTVALTAPITASRKKRWLAVVMSVTVILGGAAVGLAVAAWHSTASSALRSATRPGTSAASCQASGPANGQTWIIAWKSPQDVECVGYSGSGFVFTNHAPGGEAPLQALQDERLRFDQQQVFLLNQRADQAAENGRTEFSLVYFAGITAGPDDNYDSGQAEELEGLMVAQELAFQGSGPVFKVIIANGGSEMQDAVPVARMIIALAARDPSLLGVVGLDRSILQVKQAIGLFNAGGIPVVATTLSADGIGGTYPHYDRYYFQLSASNSTEADLILRYIQEVVPQYFKQSRQKYNSAGQIQAQKIFIYEPSANPGDLYTSTLVADLKREAPLFKGLPTLPAPQVTRQLGSQLCGAATVDIYAGRHDRPPAGSSKLDDFSEFLRIIEDDCHSGDKPFIIADDGVSRFIADPAARDQPGLGEPAISYVTNGINVLDTGSQCLHTATAAAAQASGELFSSFCTTYAAIVEKLFNLPKVQGYGLDFLWTGERVGLAFDAADLFIDAENNYQASHPAIGRAEIPGQFISDSWQGVTGLIDFTASQHIASLPLAVVRIRISSPTATPTCGYLGQGQVFGPGPGTGPCPDGSD
jgi:serine/threonine protein kinase